MTDTLRNKIVTTAGWALSNKPHFAYTEGPARWKFPTSPNELPTSCDCSSFVTGVYRKAGAPDPNGNSYKGGYTGTLLEHGAVVTGPEPGDLVIYFDGPGKTPSTGSHVAVIVEVNATGVLTISHGQQGDPEFCWVGHVEKSEGYSMDLREHEFRSYLPTQSELLKEEAHKPTSEPVVPVEPLKLPSDELVSEVAEGLSDTSGIMESPETPDAPGAI